MSLLNEKTHWKSFDELSQKKEFKEEKLYREFPEGSSELPELNSSRRTFLKMMASGLALSSAITSTSCRRPDEKIYPYAKAPEDTLPTTAKYYATATSTIFGGTAALLAKNFDGKPQQLLGLKEHPNGQKGIDSFLQAEILTLYDPERLQKPMIKGQQVSWARGLKEFKKIVDHITQNQGNKVGVLLNPTNSPSLLKLIKQAQKKYPYIKFYSHSPINNNNAYQAYDSLTKKGLEPYQTAKKKILISLDSDFLSAHKDANRLTAEFSQARKINIQEKNDFDTVDMNRLYSIESRHSFTGSNADHRIRLKSSEIQDFIFLVAKELLHYTSFNSSIDSIINDYKTQINIKETVNSKYDLAKLIEELVIDIKSNENDVEIFVGYQQSSTVHLIAQLINEQFNNNVIYRPRTIEFESLDTFIDDIKKGNIENLITLDEDIYYSLNSYNIEELFIKNNVSVIQLSKYANKTSSKASLVIPESHFLESWADYSNYTNGKKYLNLAQPLIKPLYEHTLSKIEFFLFFTQSQEQNSQKYIKETHNLTNHTWQKGLYQGFIKKDFNFLKPQRKNSEISAHLKKYSKTKIFKKELIIEHDYSIFDGRLSNNAWLQEAPDPITKLTWDNALICSINTAKEHNLSNSDVVELTTTTGSLKVAIWVVPGFADNSFHITLGYGNKYAGSIAKNTGFNAYPLLTKNNYIVELKSIKKLAYKYPLASTQDHWSMEGRNLAKFQNLEYAKKYPKFAESDFIARTAIFTDRAEFQEQDIQWGMTIDLNTCTGCNSCLIACQIENNIPTVGKNNVLLGREMHWIRLDRYFYTDKQKGNEQEISNNEAIKYDQSVELIQQPVGCMHCETAPCEQVCPVAATTHSASGLNQMTYNRCIGTRYCSNNCPFKVRRFNFFNYQEQFKDAQNEIKKLVHNPNVTVRSRGVMEKCSYCVQRINHASIDAKVKKKPQLATAFQVACEEACPTDSINFGNIANKNTNVYNKKQDLRNYRLLDELNLRTRTSFLAKIKNYNQNLV